MFFDSTIRQNYGNCALFVDVTATPMIHGDFLSFFQLNYTGHSQFKYTREKNGRFNILFSFFLFLFLFPFSFSIRFDWFWKSQSFFFFFFFPFLFRDKNSRKTLISTWNTLSGNQNSRFEFAAFKYLKRFKNFQTFSVIYIYIVIIVKNIFRNIPICFFFPLSL